MELLAEISSEETSEEFVKQSVQDAELIDKYAAIKSKVLENYKILAGQEGLEVYASYNAYSRWKCSGS